MGYFDLSVSDAARDLRRNTVLTLEKMSVPVEYTFHAAGRSQHGMSLRHAEALSMSRTPSPRPSSSLSSRLYESGCHAFYAQAAGGEDGSAMFLCQSLFDHDGNNVFWGEDDEKYHLSDIAKHYMAGILAHAREIGAITNPTVNSLQAHHHGRRFRAAVRHVGPAQLREHGPTSRSTSPASGCPRAHRASQPRPHGQPVPGQRRHAGLLNDRQMLWRQATKPPRCSKRGAQCLRTRL